MAAFPRDSQYWASVNGNEMALAIQKEFRVEVPVMLVDFWNSNGAGYFGHREMFFFGAEASGLPRDSLFVWNCKPFWRKIYPPPDKGGPLFFGETCFGEQLGFRWEDQRCVFIIFVVDDFSSFVIAENPSTLFCDVLSDRFALTDPHRLGGVQNLRGELPPGMHYAPTLSPLMGGGQSPDGFTIETPEVHFVTAVAAWEAVKK